MAEENKTITGETFSGAEAMYTTVFEGCSQYRRPGCFEFAGQKLNLVFDNGEEFIIDFLDGQNLTWTKIGGQAEYHKYDCLKATNVHYLVHFEKKGLWPREGVTLVVDLARDLVTGNFLTQGAVEDYINLVTRNLQFGAIRRPGKPLSTERHEHTKDLIGKKIQYTYSPVFSIIHIYYSEHLCRGTIPPERRAQMPPVPESERKLFEEESIYLKIAPNVYVFSWIEKNFGSGTQGFMLMDTTRIHDCGCFFGVNPQGEPESYMITAYGKYITEELPEEKIISPYTYETKGDLS